VCDNGKGFDPDVIRASGRASGIIGMRERAMIVGGALKITSRPGSGTRVEASLPIWRPRGWTRVS
jgi:signal transduction histidine kinase